MGKRSEGEFSEATKRILFIGVGGICSKYGCSVATTAAVRSKGKVKSAGDGHAAHITAAAPGGPRWCSEMSSAQRSSSNNGIWMCASCATIIDRFEEFFTVALLQEMKAVREFSQELILMQAELRFIATYIPGKFIDGIVRNFLPDLKLNANAIKDAIIQEAQYWFSFYYEREKYALSNQRQLPEMVFNPPNRLSAEISASIAGKRLNVKNEFCELDLNQRKLQILSLAKEVDKQIRDQGNHQGEIIFISHISIYLTAKNPKSGEYLSTQLLIPEANIMVLYNGELPDEKRMYLHLYNPIDSTNCMRWELEFDTRDGKKVCNSTLEVNFRDLKSARFMALRREDLQQQTIIIERLASGWTPIGIVNSEISIYGRNKPYPIIEFSIENTITQPQLTDLIERHRKIELGCKIVDETGINIIFNEVYFDERLEDNLILKGVAKVIEMRKNMVLRKTLIPRPLLTINENFAMHIGYSNDTVTFIQKSQ